MPVTAKLSQKFDERFGDDIANELVDWFNQVDATYRNDLRELNELNFQRFDARIEQRVTASENRLRTEMQVGFANLEARLDTAIAGLNTRFANFRAEIEERLGIQQGRVDERFGAMEAHLEKRFGAVETHLEARLGAVETHLEARLGAQMKWMFTYWVTTLLTLGGLMIALN